MNLTDTQIIARAFCCIDPNRCMAERGAMPRCQADELYGPQAADAVAALCKHHRLIRCGGAAADAKMAEFGA